MDAPQLQRNPVSDHPLFGTGVDEQQILLPVLEEPEITRGIALLDRGLGHGDDRNAIPKKASNPLKRIDRDPLALTQPVHQLAVVHRAAAKRRFRHPCLAAVFGDLSQELVVFHQTVGQRWSGLEFVGRINLCPASYHHLPTIETGIREIPVF